MSDAVASSLDAAEKEKLTSVGMTLMGSGEFGWEADVAASVMVKALLSWARLTGSSQIKQIILFDCDIKKAEQFVVTLHIAEKGPGGSSSAVDASGVSI
mmetsp:Transcript_30901/g.64797  ORF Transcript_30901/g.64797 Transcript_30901/m.64797 type:complete len:99 (+) Transcript_30901:1086-1382(+)